MTYVFRPKEVQLGDGSRANECRFNLRLKRGIWLGAESATSCQMTKAPARLRQRLRLSKLQPSPTFVNKAAKYETHPLKTSPTSTYGRAFRRPHCTSSRLHRQVSPLRIGAA